MLENNIYSESKALFLEELEANNIPEHAVVYIEDTKEIYTHNTYFGGETDMSNYYTKREIDNTVGDINTILESIINV